MIKKILKGTALILVLVSLVFIFWLQPERASNAVIFHGGDIVSLDTENPNPEAVYSKDGVIVALGALDALLAQAGDAELIDLQGATMLPGLIEPHSHALASALLGAVVDVSGFKFDNRAAIMKTLEVAAQEAGGDDWVLAFGWDPVMVDDLEPPTLAELDAISPDKPLLILTQMMHEAYVNSAALKAAGIGPDTLNPEHGTFRRDADGTLTGVIHEVGAIGYIMAATPQAPASAIELILSLQLSKYARAGYTTVGVLGITPRKDDSMAMLKRVASKATAPVRVRAFEMATTGAVPELGGNERFQELGIKFWMDGSPYAGGAAFAEPYENSALITERLGLPKDHLAPVNYSAEEFNADVARYHAMGLQIAVHVQGERAVDRALDAFEKALAYSPRADHRHRLEHAALITKEQLTRAKALGITVSFFIDHIYFYGDKLPDIVGSERLERYMPMRDALGAGLKVSFHGDHPATPIGPLRSFRTAVTRLTQKGNIAAGPKQAISRLEALKAMTIDAAWQLRMEHIAGSITAGKRADFTILAANPLKVDAVDIMDIEVIKTWIDGQPVDTRAVTWQHITLGTKAMWDMM